MIFILANLSFIFAANPGVCDLPKKLFFVLPPWWEYLKGTEKFGECVPAFIFPNDILPVGLAVIDMLLRLSALVAIASVIIAGVSYITATGEVQKAASARKRIYNSLMGLAIVAIASGVVAFVGNSLA